MSHASRKLGKIKAKEELAQIEAQKNAQTRQRAAARSAATQARRAKLTPEQRKREDIRNVVMLVVGVALIVVVIVAMSQSSHSPSSDSPSSPASTSTGEAKCEAAYQRLVDNGTPPINGHGTWVQYCLDGGPDGSWPGALPEP